MLSEFSVAWAVGQHDEVFNENDARKKFKYVVQNWLKEYEAAIMEEIVYNAVYLARQRGNSDYIRKWKYILVDEFQDLNNLEQEFLRIIGENSKLLMILGDPNQSIYSFKICISRRY